MNARQREGLARVADTVSLGCFILAALGAVNVIPLLPYGVPGLLGVGLVSFGLEMWLLR